MKNKFLVIFKYPQFIFNDIKKDIVSSFFIAKIHIKFYISSILN